MSFMIGRSFLGSLNLTFGILLT